METRFIKFITNPIYTIPITVIFIVIVAWSLVRNNKLETGFGTSETVSVETQKTPIVKITKVYSARKTLWDWMQLLIIPIALVIISTVLSKIQKEREEERAASQKIREEEIAAKIEYENAFQIYLKNLSDLILEHNLLTSDEGHIVRALASTRTRTTLRVLDGERRGRVIRFLYDTGLIDTDKKIISTKDLDLYGANMIGFHFKNACLTNACLDNSDFRGAKMDNVNLSKASLKKAILRDADFENADLTGISLSEALYDNRTKWPENFNPKDYGAINCDEIVTISEENY